MNRRVRLAAVCAALALPLLARAGGGGAGFGVVKVKPSTPAEKGAPAQTGEAGRPADGVASPNAVRAATADELVFGAAIHYQNLTLVPVGTNEKGPFQRYTLLEQGLARKTLAVRELQGNSGQAQVNAVEVRNSGEQPVYLLGGEMILGGKQDRIIERDTVVPGDRKWVQVPVFCVEAHRWNGGDMEFGAGGAIAHVSLRQAAMSGDQSKVWQEVARKNVLHGTQSASGTYRRTIQNATVRERIAPYRAALAKLVPSDIQVAGLVFAINGQVRVADLLGNPLLFSDLRDKLLSAYILEALEHRVDRQAAPLSVEAAKGFLLDARKAKKEQVQGAGRSINYRKESPAMVGTETVDGATGGKVRETYIAK